MGFSMTQEQIDRRDKDVAVITDTLKTLGHASSFDIAELTGIDRNRVKHLIQRFVSAQNPGCIKSVHSKGYIWEGPTEEPKKEEKPERYPDTHNSEGYPDPVAFRAIRNTVSEYAPGEVWVHKDFAGEEKLFLVLGSRNGSVTGLNVQEIDGWFDENYDISVSVKSKLYYVDPRRITSKPARSFTRSRDTLSMATLVAIHKKICEFLGIKQTTVVKEKIVEKPVEVEKIVEKPVEVIKEVPVPVKASRADVEADVSRKFEARIAELEAKLYATEHDVELAAQRADIWEEAFRAVTGTKKRQTQTTTYQHKDYATEGGLK